MLQKPLPKPLRVPTWTTPSTQTGLPHTQPHRGYSHSCDLRTTCQRPLGRVSAGDPIPAIASLLDKQDSLQGLASGQTEVWGKSPNLPRLRLRMLQSRLVPWTIGAIHAHESSWDNLPNDLLRAAFRSTQSQPNLAKLHHLWTPRQAKLAEPLSTCLGRSFPAQVQTLLRSTAQKCFAELLRIRKQTSWKHLFAGNSKSVARRDPVHTRGNRASRLAWEPAHMGRMGSGLAP